MSNGAWIDDHDPSERYKVEPTGDGWHAIMDTIPGAFEVARCKYPETAEWVASAIEHYIHGEPGSIKRRAMEPDDRVRWRARIALRKLREQL
jgi:hypothetical protein